MSDNAAIVKILDRAAELCDEGWCQGKFERRVDGVLYRDLANAMGDAASELGFGDDLPDIVDLVSSHVGVHPSWSGLMAWNDHPNRTQQEVVDMLRAVARKVEDGK